MALYNAIITELESSQELTFGYENEPQIRGLNTYTEIPPNGGRRVFKVIFDPDCSIWGSNTRNIPNNLTELAYQLILEERRCPAIWHGLRIVRMENTWVAPRRIDVTVTYGTPVDMGNWKYDAWELSFDGGDENVRVYNTPFLCSTRWWGATNITPNEYTPTGLINVTNDSVEGTDIIVPAATFNMVTSIAPDIPLAKKLVARGICMSKLYGRTNCAPFLGFGAEELLFSGSGSGLSRTRDGVTTIRLSFRVQPSMEVPITLAPGTKNQAFHKIYKRGWRYLSIVKANKIYPIPGSPDITTTMPIVAEVHKIYRTFSIAKLLAYLLSP